MITTCSSACYGETGNLNGPSMTLLETVKHYYKTKGIHEDWIGPRFGEGYIKLFPLYILPKAFPIPSLVLIIEKIMKNENSGKIQYRLFRILLWFINPKNFTG